MRQVLDNEEVVTQMSAVPSYVQSAHDLGGGHGCRPGTERIAAVLSDMSSLPTGLMPRGTLMCIGHLSQSRFEGGLCLIQAPAVNRGEGSGPCCL